ncbi:MAG TPA: prephenate dehydrogenase/arogenate dehydrogenase family protein [Acidimicrobiia bacterium]|nr:prephenate dehydrogenase/arogenate dehydrogenase family protein [Acidimicrobiia bacterium]
MAARDDAPARAWIVAVVGTGLIGGSIGLGLRQRGIEVRGHDRDPDRLARALALGAIDRADASLADAVAGADLVVVATPVGGVVDAVVAALDAGAPLVTDVGSVKGPLVAAVEAARPDAVHRFVGGHPMAGSEQDGIDGASSDLFVGATWVLTPTVGTDQHAFTAVRGMVRDLGGEVVAVTPEHHDTLVALVSHVPQLAASTLMNVATDRGEQHRTLLRLAAGGFRDMTRIAAGHPGIWPDILGSNRDAVLDALDAYVAALGSVRTLVAAGDRDGLLALLEDARAARRSLPVGVTVDDDLVELRVPVPDRPGVLAEVTTLAGRLDVNVADLEIAHSVEGGAGVMVLTVAAVDAERLEVALHERGYHTSRTALS